MDAAVTFQEYSAVTTRLIELWDESRLNEWKETVKLASEAAGEIKREDGFLMLDKYELGWSYCKACNIFAKHMIILYGEKSQWEGATTEDITYGFGDHTETVKVCKELPEVFRKHNLNRV